MELLRNNPQLSNREVLYPGEILVIRYDTVKLRNIATNGYAGPFISRELLRKTLPYLTYLTVFYYRVTKDGELTDIDDSEVIQIAKEYGVSPVMMISTMTDLGKESSEVIEDILSNEELLNRLLDNIVDMLKKKGYDALNINLQYINLENRLIVEERIRMISERLHNEGFKIYVAIMPRVSVEGTNIIFETIDYTHIGHSVDAMQLLSYHWGYCGEPPAAVAPVNRIEELVKLKQVWCLPINF